MAIYREDLKRRKEAAAETALLLLLLLALSPPAPFLAFLLMFRLHEFLSVRDHHIFQDGLFHPCRWRQASRTLHSQDLPDQQAWQTPLRKVS